MENKESRLFIRHPSDIPIEIQLENTDAPKSGPMENISIGGLAFASRFPFERGALIKIKIRLMKPVFEAKGKVMWCNVSGGRFDIGIAFVEANDTFRIRMVEQICRIEHYRNEIQLREGRILNGMEAALEWIDKYAGSFEKEKIEI
jgi:hypothetical protein